MVIKETKWGDLTVQLPGDCLCGCFGLFITYIH